MGDNGDRQGQDANASPARLLTATEREVDGTRWSVEVLYMSDQAHHVRIKRDGLAVAEHVGSVPTGWPGEEFPPEVRDALDRVVEQLSWS